MRRSGVLEGRCYWYADNIQLLVWYWEAAEVLNQWFRAAMGWVRINKQKHSPDNVKCY